MSGIIKIRPHHLMCMKNFNGKGYSDEFINNMTRVICFLKVNPLSPVEITTGCDNICQCCPNNTQGGCVTEEMVNTFDAKVIESIGIKASESYKWNELENLSNKYLSSYDIIKNICGDCSWFYICGENYK